MKNIAIPRLVDDRQRNCGFWYPVVKRFLDIVLSLFGLVIGGPLLVAFGILVRIESKGPVFYKQIRSGKNGKPFVIYKLRSMSVAAETNGVQWATKNDWRITRVGGFIRKYKIDEIPQFFNILCGEMSIVGPRPERPAFIAQFRRKIPPFVNRLQVKPGLTGWAQVNGSYEMLPEEKLHYDLYYIQHQSIRLDYRIIFKTLKVLLSCKGPW